MIIGCWVTGFYLKSVLLFIIASYLLLGLLIKTSCFIGTLLSWQCIDRGRMVSFQNRQLEEGSLTAEVLIYSDTIKVNGDLVTFEGNCLKVK